jgi:hypothetical protein
MDLLSTLRVICSIAGLRQLTRPWAQRRFPTLDPIESAGPWDYSSAPVVKCLLRSILVIQILWPLLPVSKVMHRIKPHFA